MAPSRLYILESVSNDDGDGNENGKKCNRVRLEKQQICTCITLVCTLSLHDHTVRMPNFTFRGERTYFAFIFLNFDIQLQTKMPTFEQRIERDGISAIKFEAFLNSLFK